MIIPAAHNDPCFEFTFKSKTLTQGENIVCLCLFFCENSFDEEKFNTRLSDISKAINYTSDVRNGVINKLIIILPALDECKAYAQKTFDKVVSHRFSYLMKSGDPIFLLYDKDENWLSGNEMTLAPTGVHELTREVKLHGLFNIFDLGSGILESGPGHHYVLQNHYHADKFIRAANILTNSSYIDFIALFLLSFISEEDKIIYIDTSGIASLVYSINKLKSIFSKGVNLSFMSFDSYNGLDRVPNDIDSKIIISASTSGGLSDKLVQKGFSTDKINILFYLNEKMPSAKVLCNLFEFNNITGGNKYSYFQIEKETNCAFCQNSSYPIKIIGEQFLPEEFKVDTFIFDVNDRPLWLTQFIRSYFNKPNIITVYYNESKKPRREIFIHFDKIFEVSAKDDRAKRFFASKLPFNIDVIIYYSDDGSIYLKDLVASLYSVQKKPLEILDSEILLKEESLRGKNILVISSTITTGRRLVDTSLRLRDLKLNGICYFVGLSRTSDEYTIDITRKYVGFDNALGKDINPLIIIDSIFVSDISSTYTFTQTNVSSWDDELKIIKAFNSKEFNSRVNDIEGNALVNNVFWGNANNHPLKLRSNFAFYRSTKIQEGITTQAEVFFLLNTVLHNFRKNPNKKIFQSAYHRHVISPEVFVMYNDGIIQASILRSASPIELNYNFWGDKMNVANEMLNVLKYIFTNFENEIGEASIEFLIALCTKRLQVIEKELMPIIDKLTDNVKVSTVTNKDVILKLCDRIQKNLTGK